MGAVERGLLRQGLRYALGLRLVVVGLSSSVSLLLVALPHEAVAVAIVAAFNLWSGLYAYLMVRRPRSWLAVADIAVVCLVCLTQAWTVRSDPRGGATWVLIVIEMVLVTAPWQMAWPLLAGATLTVCCCYFYGTTLVDPGGWLVNASVEAWTAAEAALSWGLYRFVRRAARASDRTVERAEELRRVAAVAAARRADEREYLAALHDTAAATLLMVGNGVVSQPSPWLSEQARRDLRELNRPEPTGPVDLVALLREAAATSPLRIDWETPATLSLPAVDAVTLSRGAREALTNVLRHAGTGTATIRVTPSADRVVVEIIDGGVGFDPARLSPDRYGVTRSLVERLTRTGGSARVESSPGAGTVVTMTVPLSEPDDTDDSRQIAASFQEGLHWSIVVLSLSVLCLLDLPRLLSNAAAFTSTVAQLVAWGGLLAVTVVAGFFRGFAARWRWMLVVAVLACSALATATVRPEWRQGAAHWSEGDAGWQLVLLLLDARIGLFAAVLAAQYLLTFAQTALGGQAALSLAGVVSATWVVLAYQLAVAMIAAVLRSLAASSARAVRTAEQLRTSEEVARHLHGDRAARIAGLAASTVPLLEGLAAGQLDPGDVSVQRRCAAEAARMRRLIAEDGTAADQLAHELRACIELAERNGVAVTFADYGARPELPPLVRRRLTEPAIAALATARGRARLTISGTGEAVTVSVVAACPPPQLPPDADGVSRSVVPDGDRVWILAEWAT